MTLTGAIVLGAGIYQTSASEGNPKLSQDQIIDVISSQYPGTITKIELETDFNEAKYELEIDNEGDLYSLTLDGNTGEILQLKEKVILKDPQDQEETPENEGPKDETNGAEKGEKEEKDQDTEKNEKQEPTKVVIDAKKAIQIAQNEFSGYITELELEKDDGQLIYEVELFTEDGEVEMEIDAFTGEILVIEMDHRGHHMKNKGDRKHHHRHHHSFQREDLEQFISAIEAIEIAESKYDGLLTEIEIGTEGKQFIYEVEFKSGDEEAEIKIDAISGKVLKVEIDD